MTQTLTRQKNIPNLTQEGRVLQVLKENLGQWISKRYFQQTMMLSQAGRAIHNLEKNPEWQKQYAGYKIEHSDHRDEYNFKYIRLISKTPVGQLF